MEIVSQKIFDELIKFNGEPTLIVVSKNMMKSLVAENINVSNFKITNIKNVKFAGIRMIRSNDLENNEILIK
jgi:nitrogenase subunit NifH